MAAVRPEKRSATIANAKARTIEAARIFRGLSNVSTVLVGELFGVCFEVRVPRIVVDPKHQLFMSTRRTFSSYALQKILSRGLRRAFTSTVEC